MCLGPSFISILWIVCLYLLLIFFYQIFYLFSSIFKSSLHIEDISPLPVVYSANIFLILKSLLNLLILLFAMQKFKIFMSSKLCNFFLLPLNFESCLNEPFSTKNNSLLFSSSTCVVLFFTFTSLIHLGIYSIYVQPSDFRYHINHILDFYILDSIYRLCLFHWLVYLSLYQYHTIIMIKALQYRLMSHSACPLSERLLFQCFPTYSFVFILPYEFGN